MEGKKVEVPVQKVGVPVPLVPPLITRYAYVHNYRPNWTSLYGLRAATVHT